MELSTVQWKRSAFDRKEFDWHSIARDIAEECSCFVSDVEEMLNQERHQIEQETESKAFIPVLPSSRAAWRRPLSISTPYSLSSTRIIPTPGGADSGRKQNDC